jgi:hypothetical protein
MQHGLVSQLLRVLKEDVKIRTEISQVGLKLLIPFHLARGAIYSITIEGLKLKQEKD